jgi:hypothetical protein
MGRSWRDKPTGIDEWDENIDTVIAIDESGTTDLKDRKSVV